MKLSRFPQLSTSIPLRNVPRKELIFAYLRLLLFIIKTDNINLLDLNFFS